jgi:phage/plasmid-associated DNA primase
VIRARNGIVNPLAAWRAAQAGEPYEPEPYTPENATTIQLPWRYVPGADSPKIMEFLRQVHGRATPEGKADGQATDEMIEFIFETIGYTLLPRGPVRKAVLHLGPTGAGKSITLHIHTALIGEDQVSTSRSRRSAASARRPRRRGA